MKTSPKDIILCDYNEVQIWTKSDKHKDANKVLKGKLAAQMADLLRIKGDISKEPQCISCHGVLVEDKQLIHETFSLDDGVSCVACHGPYVEWVERHSPLLRRKEWRGKSRKEKEEVYGMRDLWDPEKRAMLCASCHIGNAAEKKVVTHAMYAAGHPPLPGIEMAFFSDAMPRHWKYLSEKSPAVQKILDYNPDGDLERPQLVVVAGLVSFRESMNLLAAQAELGAAAKDADHAWPELAQFDCYACHHDLKSKSWRQQRGYARSPGRPDMRPWSMTMVRLAILHASKGDEKREKELVAEMHDKMKALSDAFDKQPFGDPVQVAAGARSMSKWAYGLLSEVQKPGTFNRAASQQLLAGFGMLAKRHLLDFDSARQLTWGFRTVQEEFEPHMFDPAKSKNPELIAAWKDLDTLLQLDLPKGQVEIAKDYLKATLEKLSKFEPEQFNTRFERLEKARQQPK